MLTAEQKARLKTYTLKGNDTSEVAAEIAAICKDNPDVVDSLLKHLASDPGLDRADLQHLLSVVAAEGVIPSAEPYLQFAARVDQHRENQKQEQQLDRLFEQISRSPAYRTAVKKQSRQRPSKRGVSLLQQEMPVDCLRLSVLPPSGRAVRPPPAGGRDPAAGAAGDLPRRRDG